MTQEKIEDLLRKKIGLSAVSMGSKTLGRIIRCRMEACGVSEMVSYINRLQTVAGELEQLIEEAIVPETWFFRDREPFVFLIQYVAGSWWLNNPGRILRILSVPCSTGEEPYSIAIALLEAGLSGKNFIIDAVDISQKSLLKAKQAVYRKNSFRSSEPAFVERYFTQKENEYHLCNSVKNNVNFFRGNILEKNFLIDRSPYDVIFCRNVLIYFDRTAIETTNQVLDRLLNKQGLLFVGHAETGLISAQRFVSARRAFAFAFRKAEETRGSCAEGQADAVSVSPPGGSGAEETVNFLTQSRLKTQNAPMPDALCPMPHVQIPDLGAARRLADLGQLEEATALCETYLSQNRVSVEAYVLLGQVHQAAGKKELAEQCFQKAIYLEPNCYEALIHLALLKENRGDIAGGAIIRQRIERLQRG